MKYKVGDKVKIRKGSLAGNIYTISHIESCGHIELSDLPYVFFDYELEPVDADGGKIAYAPNGAALFWKPEPEKPISIEEQLGLPKGVSIHDLSTSEWYNPMRLTFKNGSSIEAIPNEDAIRSKEPELVWIDKIALPTATETKEMAERVRREILKFTNAFPKEEKNLKFTFYTEEGYRIDKSNNSKVETITTFVKINGFDNTYLGMATCDKVDYSEREGVINALANAMCNGNFDREFSKAVKDNARADKKARTCTYCGQLFDTVAEKETHEAWHVERRKARHERYLLRKRAKEIAFEEQAQKMAKEMIAEDSKK